MSDLAVQDHGPEWHVDPRVHLHGVPWSVYEGLDKARGDSSAIRITYFKGELELMTLSINHEEIKKTLARLIEAFADAHELDLYGFGSWTQKDKLKKLGVEPDECYVLDVRRPRVPSIVLEVALTSGGIDKLEIYREFRVPEVWIWNDDRLEVHALKRGRYVQVERSAVLPGLDLTLLAKHARNPNQPAAVRAFRAALRKKR